MFAATAMGLSPAFLAAQLAGTNPGQALAEAGAAVHRGESVAAESGFRAAAAAALLQIAEAQTASGNHAAALDSLQEAAQNLARPEQILLRMAEAYLQLNKGNQAEALARQVLADDAQEPIARQVLASAYQANGRDAEAVQELERLLREFPGAADIRFQLASVHLKKKDLPAAQQQFALLKKLRPVTATHVLIGRVLRDMQFYDEAEQELRAALAQDRSARRANYYLGSIQLLREGVLRMEEAAGFFRRELEIAPEDYLANLNLGITYIGQRKPAEALAPLQIAVRLQPDDPDPHYYLGQAHAGAGDDQAAVRELERSLALTPDPKRNNFQAANAEYMLAQSLRKLGRAEDADQHFARSRDLRALATQEHQKRLSAGMGGAPALLLETGGSPDTRAAEAAARRFGPVAARAYFHLGVLSLQEGDNASAAALFFRATRHDADSVQLAYWLGVARYQASRFADAIEPLQRARAAGFRAADAGRLLSMAYFNSGQHANAAALLETQVTPASDPALQLVYGTALARSGQSLRATQVFQSLLQRHGGNAEVHLMLGQAQAQQNQFEEALGHLERALELDPALTEASISASQIYIRQGELPKAEAALRRALQSSPAEVQANYLLAFVLDLQERSPEALPLVKTVLESTPGHADARYLYGKILLAGGDAQAAAEQLQAAAQLAPAEARVRYQLAQAYTRLGKTADAEREFAAFRELKGKER